MNKRHEEFFMQRRQERRRFKAVMAALGMLIGGVLTVALLSIISPFMNVKVGGNEYRLLISVALTAFTAFYALGYLLGSIRLNATLLSVLSDMDPVEKKVFKDVLEKAIKQEEEEPRERVKK